MHAYFRPKRSTRCFALSRHLLLRIAILCTLCLSDVISAQSVLTIDTQQCAWHPGDDPAWAAPTLDETGWQPFAQWKLNPDQPRIWIRCHADLSSLREFAHPQIQVSLWAANQLYVNGVLTGSAGNLRSGNFSMDTVRAFPLPATALHPATIALRITWRLAAQLPAGALPPLDLSTGSDSVLHSQRAARLLAQSAPRLLPALCFSVAGVLGLIVFGFFVYDSSRRELFLLALYSVCVACIYLDFLFAAALVAYSSFVYVAVWSFLALLVNITLPVFFFEVARRRVPVAFWIVIAIAVLLYIPSGLCAFLPPGQALWLHAFSARYLFSIHDLAVMAAFAAPFFAFWPYSRITRRTWPLAGACLLWASTSAALFAVRATALGGIPGVPDLYSRWGSATSEAQALVVLCAMTALFALLLRDQRQVALDRAVLAGEMHAASEIQRMLAPVEIDCVPSLKIDVAFHPMREVGGDFYLCRVLPDGRQRLLLGDVSGKGSAAAMTATLILGGADDHDVESPAELLAHLNRILLNSRVNGFATCLCADFASDGRVTLANAGHLPPYLRGEELSVPSGLPLGLSPRSPDAFQQTTFALEPSDTLTLISDGVVEARSSTGELFGFDRTCAISNQSAEQIALAAQSHGQEDDITVLTLTFAHVGAAHA
jgi:hypothetical protein